MKIDNRPLRQSWLYALLLLAFIVSTVNASAQDFLKIIENSEGRDFKEVVQEVEKLFEGKDKGRGSGYKHFQRWVELNRSRLTKDGKIQNISKLLVEQSKNYDNYLKRNAARIAASTASWTSLGATSRVTLANGYTGGMGRVNVVVADPSNVNIIYAGTPAGGLWRSTNGGTSWTCLTESLTNLIGVSGIAIDPTSSSTNRTIYFLSGDGDGGNTSFTGIYKSTNNGTSWTNIGPTGLGVSNGRKLVMHPTNNQILFAVTDAGIIRSTNAGSSWSIVRSGYFYDLEFKPGTPSTIYASSTTDVWVSTNTGTNWSTLTTGLPVTNDRIILAVTPAQPSYIYVLYGATPSSGVFGGVYRSTNGSSFTLMSNTPNILGWDDLGGDDGDQSWYDLALAVSPTNANEVHVGGVNCWKSINGGSTWTISSRWGIAASPAGDYTHADIHDLAFFGSTLFCGSDGGVFRSTNNAGDWSDISAGLQISQIYRIGGDPHTTDRTVCGLQDNGVNYIQNQTLYAWFGADGMESFASAVNPSLMFGSTQNGGLLKSVDNGLTVKGIKPAGTGDGDWITPFVADPVNPSTLYAGYTDIYKSTNEGRSWTNISNGLAGFLNASHIAVSPANNQYIYVAKYEQLYRTTNGGTSWTDISNTGVTGFSITDIEAHPTNSNILYVVTGNGVFKYTVNTNTWENIGAGSLPSVALNCIVYDKTSSNNSIYLGTDLGVFYKNDALSSWAPFSDGLPKIMVRDIEIHYATRTLRIGTYGRGAWKSPLYDISNIQVSITSPGISSDFFAGNSLTIQASASATSGTITKVEFYSGTTKLGEDLTSPYSYTIPSLAVGNYQITAKAYTASASLVSNEVGFRVWSLRNADNPAGTVNGLDYSYYEGVWESLPDFATLTPAESGTETNFSLAQRNRDDEFGFTFKGFVDVPTDGVYTFYISSDDGSKLYIGNTLLVDNDGLHGNDTEAERIALKAGKHAISVSYFENGGDQVLSVAYSGPGIAKQLIPATALFRTSSSAVTVTLTAPANNSVFTAPANVELAATVQNPATVTKVEFYRENGATPVKLGEDLSSPYTYLYNNVAAGEYYVFARALAGTQVVATSSTVHFTVNGGNASPVVNITSPANNANFSAPASFTVSASATDADGTINRVEFYNGTQLLNTDNAAPYAFNWTNIPEGTYTLKAIAYDNLLATGTSSDVVVTVGSSGNCALNEAIPAAASYVVRNDWGDQGSGSGVTNENSALKVTHRAWGKNELWVIRTGTAFAITSGQTYAIKFDFHDSPGFVINGVDVGFATGVNSSNNGPTLVQSVVAAPSGYSSSGFTTKTVNITASYTGNVNLVFRLRWASQPTVQVVDYIKNISVCQNQAFPLVADVKDLQVDSKLLVLPNPADFEFMIKTEKYITLMKVTNAMGQEVYTASDITEGTEFSFGKEFATGIYNVYVRYGDGSEGSFKLSKAR